MDRVAFNALLAQYATPEASGDGQVSWDGGVKCVIPSVRLYGKCGQDTLEGKNLADITDAYDSYGGDVTSTRIILDTTGKVKSAIIPVTAGETYTISYTGTLSGQRYFWFDQEPVIGQTLSIGGEYSTRFPANGYAITASAAAKYLFVVFTRNAEAYISDKYQVEAGPDATSYEPYCGGMPAPNPDYPMPIRHNNGTFRATDAEGAYDGGTAQAPDLWAIPGTAYRDEWDARTGRGVRRCGVIKSYAGEEIGTPWISTTGELSEGATVVYGIPDTPFAAALARLTMPGGPGRILQTGGDVAECPIAAKYLKHS